MIGTVVRDSGAGAEEYPESAKTEAEETSND